MLYDLFKLSLRKSEVDGQPSRRFPTATKPTAVDFLELGHQTATMTCPSRAVRWDGVVAFAVTFRFISAHYGCLQLRRHYSR